MRGRSQTEVRSRVNTPPPALARTHPPYACSHRQTRPLTLCLPENMAASMDFGSLTRVSLGTSAVCSPPTFSRTMSLTSRVVLGHELLLLLQMRPEVDRNGEREIQREEGIVSRRCSEKA